MEKIPRTGVRKEKASTVATSGFKTAKAMNARTYNVILTAANLCSTSGCRLESTNFSTKVASSFTSKLSISCAILIPHHVHTHRHFYYA